jgi:hypothetical protein
MFTSAWGRKHSVRKDVNIGNCLHRQIEQLCGTTEFGVHISTILPRSTQPGNGPLPETEHAELFGRLSNFSLIGALRNTPHGKSTERNRPGAPVRRRAHLPIRPGYDYSGRRRSGLSSSSMLTSLNVITRTCLTKRAGRYMSHTHESDIRNSK